MWILPKQIISAFAPGTEESTWLSSRWCQMGAPLLMWRSKPSPSRTWSQRWKRENWIKHLSGRTLRRSRQNNFTDWWTSSLAGTRANRSVPPVSDEEPMTQDIFGHTFDEQFDLFAQAESSSKTSKDTSRLDSPQSSATWTKMVIEQRGEYLVRRNAARLINANESLSWPTPDASVEKFRLGGNSQQSRSLEAMGRRGELSPPDPVNRNSTGKNPGQWPTPNTMDVLPPRPNEKLAEENRTRGGRKNRQALSNLREAVHSPKYQNWPTPKAATPSSTRKPGTGGKELAEEAKKKNWATPEAQNQTGCQTKHGQTFPRLGSQVQNWPTPILGDSHLTSTPEAAASRLAEDKKTLSRMNPGKLNPNWVEQLMGVPVGWTQLPTEWTDFDSSETALSRQQ